MKEARKTIIVAALAAALLNLEARLPLDHARSLVACIKAGGVAAGPDWRGAVDRRISRRWPSP